MWINLPGNLTVAGAKKAAPLLPSHCHSGKVKALYVHGHHSWTTGLVSRPSFPQQGLLAEIVGDTFLPVTVTCRE